MPSHHHQSEVVFHETAVGCVRYSHQGWLRERTNTLLRQAARETWLTPCAQSPVCDYRFFVDRLEGNVTDALATENR